MQVLYSIKTKNKKNKKTFHSKCAKLSSGHRTRKISFHLNPKESESESEVPQSHLTLCDPMDYSLSGSSDMGFTRQECWSGLPFPSPRDLPEPGIEPGSPTFQADVLPSEPPGKPF